MEGDGVKNDTEFREGGLHHAAVEGMAGVELAGGVAGGFQRLGEGFDGIGRAGDNGEAGGVEGGDVEGGGEEGAEAGFAEADGQHGTRGHGGHEAAADGNEFGGVGEGDDSGKRGGDVFSDAVAEHGGGSYAEGEEEFSQSVFDGEERRLGVGGVVEVREVSQVEAGVGKGVAAGVIGFAVGGFVGVEFVAHAGVLGALTGKEEEKRRLGVFEVRRGRGGAELGNGFGDGGDS